jgi:hypothetical protein
MSKREKFLESCRKQKLDTVRWSLGAGGQSPAVRDEEGYTAIMICAAGRAGTHSTPGCQLGYMDITACRDVLTIRPARVVASLPGVRCDWLRGTTVVINSQNNQDKRECEACRPWLRATCTRRCACWWTTAARRARRR